jgi:hypothetical protein
MNSFPRSSRATRKPAMSMKTPAEGELICARSYRRRLTGETVVLGVSRAKRAGVWAPAICKRCLRSWALWANAMENFKIASARMRRDCGERCEGIWLENKQTKSKMLCSACGQEQRPGGVRMWNGS